MLEAYLDESGTHKGSPVLSVAAWVGQRAYWKRFLSYWGDRYFHAAESKCDPLRPALFDAIQDSQLEGFVAWMNPADYKAHASQLFQSAVGNAYAVCTLSCALGICKYARQEKLGQIAFVIEGGQPNVDWIRRVVEDMRAKPRFGIASVSVSTKKRCTQLCTADFLAYSRTSDLRWFDRFYETGRVSEHRITSEAVAKMSSQLRQGHILIKRKKELSRARRKQS